MNENVFTVSIVTRYKSVAILHIKQFDGSLNSLGNNFLVLLFFLIVFYNF